MKRTLTLLVVAAAAGCDSQAPSDYQGDALGTIHGTIRNQAASAPGAAEVVLLWHLETEDDQEVPVAVRTEVEGSFPASFTLDLFEPPPEETYGQLDGLNDNPSEHRAAMAMIFVFDEGQAPDGSTDYDFETSLSWEERYIVTYAPEAVPADEIEMGIDIPAGYGLMDFQDGARYSPIDTPVEIRLVDDKSELGTPFGDDG